MAELKVITQPSVYLVSTSAINDKGLTDFLNDNDAVDLESDAETACDELPEVAGRLCYMSYSKPRPGGNKAYLQHILEAGHGSVLEHSVFGFIFTGVSRSLTHELIRHRTLSFSELSQRYVNCADVAFVLPPALLPYQKRHEAWSDNMRLGLVREDDPRRLEALMPYSNWMASRRNDLEEYEEWTERLLAGAPAELTGTDKRKWARQAARSVLPNCAETKIFVTGNARALRSFIEQRASRHADAEIRRLACAVHEVLLREAPAIFSDYRATSLGDGTYELTTPFKKV